MTAFAYFQNTLLLANGLTPAQVLEELSDLEPADIVARLRFASRRLAHPVVAA
jgi:uncharacterized protein (DUF433 family)